MNYSQFLKKLSVETTKILVNMPNESKGEEFVPYQLESKMIFPNYEQKDKKPRISEQEARFAFCHAFENANHELFYSVETPTFEKYSFSEDIKLNPKGISAQSDMSIFSLQDDKFKQIINIEFKAHNVEKKNIEKDFLKLLAEPAHGLFFHLVESVNSGTIKSILEKYNNSMNNSKLRISEKKLDNRIRDYSHLFVIVILNPYPAIMIQKMPSENQKFNFEHENYKQGYSIINNWNVKYL